METVWRFYETTPDEKFFMHFEGFVDGHGFNVNHELRKIDWVMLELRIWSVMVEWNVIC